MGDFGRKKVLVKRMCSKGFNCDVDAKWLIYGERVSINAPI
jgi:hypothetical protein